MALLKPFPTSKFIGHCFLVAVVFMIIDFICYGLIFPSGTYQNDLAGKVIWTILLAIPFTYLFYRYNSTWWHPVGTLPDCKNVPAGDPCCKNLGAKAIGRGFLFGVVVGAAFIFIIALSGYLVMYSFISFLEAFCGIP